MSTPPQIWFFTPFNVRVSDACLGQQACLCEYRKMISFLKIVFVQVLWFMFVLKKPEILLSCPAPVVTIRA